MTRVLVTALLCLMAACSESFLPASAVVDLRVVAAVVEIEGKPGRANPDPEDSIQVALRVIDSGPTPPLQWSLVACVPEPTLLGAPICRNVIPDCVNCEATPPEDPLALPIVRFQVPPQEVLEEAEADRVLLQGAICANGAPAGVDAIIRFITGETDTLEPCEDPADEGRFLVVRILIERDPEDPNLHPEIANIKLNGEDWPPPFDEGVPREAPESGCEVLLEALDPEDRARHPKENTPPSIIELSVTPESLQEYTLETEDRGTLELREEMQISWLADRGGFERPFSFISDPEAPSTEIQWAPPTFAKEGGTLVRFNVVIRDGRGGTDLAERGLCITDAAASQSSALSVGFP